MSNSIIRRFRAFTIIAITLLFFAAQANAQKILHVHKTEKQETIFGIAKQYGVTIEELANANPEMRKPNFTLKKGMMINIPEHDPAKGSTIMPVDNTIVPSVSTQKKQESKTTVKATPKSITIGVMLPLHDINGDGHRMVEYYRGMLIAINDLKNEGFNVTVNAWNLAEGDDASKVLADGRAAQCDIIFGPLYTTQVRTLAEFCSEKNIRLVIPFSINGNDVEICPQIYQVYQSPAELNAAAIDQFMVHFKDTHPVFVDCNDTSSKKGAFTFGLRKVLEERGIEYSITNLNNTPEMFSKAFSTSKRNMVILNTGRSPELGQVFKKLEELVDASPKCKISMFGYNDWLLYTGIYDQRFRRFDTYIPSTYDYNGSSARVMNIEQQYQTFYHTSVQKALPRFALTGYDQTMFFIRGIHKYGQDFHGFDSQNSYSPVQTPLSFKRIGKGGYKNSSFILIHLK